MKRFLGMDCDTVLDELYDPDRDGSVSPLTQLRMGLHLFFCPGCTAELRKLRRLEEVMRTEFFPPSPNLEETIMERMYEETGTERIADAPTGLSFRSWVIIGFFVLLSFSSSFFGGNFIEIANTQGLSFLLPVGLTFGIVLTGYGAFFIGSHLKELSMRFRLR